MDLHVKNVPTLIVKVYEINTFNYYQQNQREVNTDINLDGLVANLEQTHQYAEPAVRRVARHFEFPELTKPGVYVIDFIGNGKNSRAVIHKGSCGTSSRTSTAGQIFTILDEKNEVLRDATLWLSGREYRAGGRRHHRGSVQHATGPAADYLDSPGPVHAGRGLNTNRKTMSWRPGSMSIARHFLSRKTATVLVRPSLRAQRHSRYAVGAGRCAADHHLHRPGRRRLQERSAQFRAVRGPGSDL